MGARGVISTAGPAIDVRDTLRPGEDRVNEAEHEVRVRYSPQRVIECGPMWAPKTWTELENLVGVGEETPSLEFKRLISPNTAEVAKDIAAMTVNGGVVIYGMDEDKATGKASALIPIVLRGVEERLHSIAGMKIAPVPVFDVATLTANPEDSEGVIVVSVPPSTQAPHCVEHRFPCREGTTTRNLTEPEIARLYANRQAAAGERPDAVQLMQGFRHSLQVWETDVGGQPLPNRSIGEGRLLARPLVMEGLSLPGGAWQSQNLADAVARARDRTSSLFANPTLTYVFNRLREWTALDISGWRAGDDSSAVYPMYDVTAIAAIMTYPGALSFHIAWGLDTGHGLPPAKPSA